VSLTILLTLTGCVPAQDDERCAPLVRELEECAATQNLPLECDQLTESDVDFLADALDAMGCEAFSELLPLDGDPLAASCNLLGEGCLDEGLPAAASGAARYPLVLVNGIDVSPLFSWSDRIVEVLEQSGNSVHLAVVPPYDATYRRAAALWERVEEVREETGAPRVNLICHSLGGLDCRYLVSPGGLHWEVDASEEAIQGAVASITTVGTAHYGTPVADAALGYLASEDPEDAIDALATTLGEWFSGEVLEEDVDLRAAIGALTESQSLAFNASITDAPGVYYQSWAGFSRPFGEPWADPEGLAGACATEGGDGLALYSGDEDHLSLVLQPSYDMVAELAVEGGEALAPNDGLCPTRSARWGSFRGCVPADHQEQLGRGNLPDINVRNRLDIASFYAEVAADLGARGM
jgi:triacylglycerol lipase